MRDNSTAWTAAVPQIFHHTLSYSSTSLFKFPQHSKLLQRYLHTLHPAAMSTVYNEDRPLFANGKQTPLYKEMSDYAYKPEVQAILQRMCTDLFRYDLWFGALRYCAHEHV